MVTQSQKDKAELFLKLHSGKEILVLMNTWDPGSSKLIEACGFKAIATTSNGISASLGYPDGQVIPLEDMTDAIARIVKKVSLPVTADIEGGFGRNAGEIVRSIEKVISTGIVGINIEDGGKPDPKLLDENEFCERIRAIRSLSTSLGFHLVINARTDVFLAGWGQPENRLAETVRRGNKYRDAGADCIFVPGVSDGETIAVLVKEIKAPVNILVNPTTAAAFPPAVSKLQEMGVARLSLGSSMMKASLAVTKKIADDMARYGSYAALSGYLSPVEETQKAYGMAVGSGNSPGIHAGETK